MYCLHIMLASIHACYMCNGILGVVPTYCYVLREPVNMSTWLWFCLIIRLVRFAPFLSLLNLMLACIVPCLLMVVACCILSGNAMNLYIHLLDASTGCLVHHFSAFKSHSFECPASSKTLARARERCAAANSYSNPCNKCYPLPWTASEDSDFHLVLKFRLGRPELSPVGLGPS
jgi:hypothetical protein